MIPIALGYRTTFVVCAVVRRSAFSFSARTGGGRPHTSDIFFQVAELSLLAISLTLQALNMPFRAL